MTYTKNIGSSTGGTFSLPTNSTGVNPAFLATNYAGTGTEFYAGGRFQIARYVGTASTGNGSGDQTITFTGIPQNFKHLYIAGTISPGSTTTGSGTEYMSLRLNNDSTASNYRYNYESSANTSSTSHNHNYSIAPSTSTSAQLFPVQYSNYTPNLSYGVHFEMWIPNYSRSETFMMKRWSGFSYNAEIGVVRFVGQKNNQVPASDKAPITRIDLGYFGNVRMCADSEIILYGVS